MAIRPADKLRQASDAVANRERERERDKVRECASRINLQAN